MKHTPGAAVSQPLKREIGVFAAVMLGMGSIVGTGVFVSIAVAAAAAGPAVVIAIAVAAVVATCNGLSSAQLAAAHPVSGGTYEYGYRFLRPWLGFTAGWMFVCAKSASAATAALGFAGYVLNAVAPDRTQWLTPVALAAVIALTAVVLSGMRRSSGLNILIVSITLGSLVLFVLAALPSALEGGREHLWPLFGSPTPGGAGPIRGLLEACALMFVAYTGYGRIATLGEEVREPRRSIPTAILITLALSMLLYLAVGLVAVASAGADVFAAAAVERAAPLEVVARRFAGPWVGWVIAIGAVTAMLGVLLNLVLGLSRVVLAMGRRGDLPPAFARLDRSGAAPRIAVIAVGIVIAALVLIGDVKTTWSFSAFTVLIYYALTNAAALRLDRSQRRYPRAVAWAGLAACLLLAFWVEPAIWLAGLGLIGAGLLWRLAAARLWPRWRQGV